MNIGWPQLIYIGMMIFNLTLEGMKHRQQKEGKHSFGVTMIATILSLGLVYWGGFFE